MAYRKHKSPKSRTITIWSTKSLQTHIWICSKSPKSRTTFTSSLASSPSHPLPSPSYPLPLGLLTLCFNLVHIEGEKLERSNAKGSTVLWFYLLHSLTGRRNKRGKKKKKTNSMLTSFVWVVKLDIYQNFKRETKEL